VKHPVTSIQHSLLISVSLLQTLQPTARVILSNQYSSAERPGMPNAARVIS
jgi:hypothetical protein